MKAITPLVLLTALFMPLQAFAEEGEPAMAEATGADTMMDASEKTMDEPTVATADLLEQQRQADIATSQAPETEIFWLDAGEQQRLALYLASVEPEAHAGIIIFPDTSTSADWPDFIHPLRTDLTEHGWSTLTLNMPPEADPIIPERTLPTRQDSNTLQSSSDLANTDAVAAEGSTADAPEETSEAASETDADKMTSKDAMTETGMAKMDDKGTLSYPALISELSTGADRIIAEKGHERQIIMGVGNGAVWAIQYFLARNADNQYLVLIDPRDSATPDIPTLTSLISQLEAPALDLWFDDNPLARQNAGLRKRTAQRNKATEYSQVRINRRVDATRKRPQWLTKQVRGIIESRILKQMEMPAVEAPPEGQVTPGA